MESCSTTKTSGCYPFWAEGTLWYTEIRFNRRSCEYTSRSIHRSYATNTTDSLITFLFLINDYILCIIYMIHYPTMITWIWLILVLCMITHIWLIIYDLTVYDFTVHDNTHMIDHIWFDRIWYTHMIDHIWFDRIWFDRTW